MFFHGTPCTINSIILNEDSMSNFPQDTDIILVAILPNPKDLNIARLLGWYRIPLKSCPKVISVDYLAFYQTGAFGEEERWKIKNIAPVRGHELTTRRELFKDEPDHPRANEEYYKIQLGPIQSLERPIFADRWRRITFFYTTGELLRNAVSMRDLVVSGEERLFLWKSLQERAEKYGNGNQVIDEFKDWNLDLISLITEWDNIKEFTNGNDV
jgi:hypothetical protein